MLNVTDHNQLVKAAQLNTTYFKYNTLFLKGCRECNKLVDYNHTTHHRFKKEGHYVYLCECAECNSPMLLNNINFYLLHDKV